MSALLREGGSMQATRTVMRCLGAQMSLLGVAMTRPAILLACTLGFLLSPSRAYSDPTIQRVEETIEIAERELYVRPIDFVVDATHAYVVYARYPSYRSMAVVAEHDVLLGIYDRSSGVEVARLTGARLWGRQLKMEPFQSAHATSYRDGVVVSTVDEFDESSFFAYVDRNGLVGSRGHVQDFAVRTLGRYRNFVHAASARRVALFDEEFDLKYDWRTLGTLLLAEPTQNEIVVLDGVQKDSLWAVYSPTVRWLALGDELEERMAVPVPVSFVSVLPIPKLLTWPDRLLLVAIDETGSRECRLALGHGVFRCSEAAWERDFKAWGRGWYGTADVARSGADGYVVTHSNACAIWSRRYDGSHSVAARQLAVPSGSSRLGLVRNALVKEWRGDVFLLTSALLTKGWEGRKDYSGEYRAVLRKVPLSQSPPVRPATKIDGCPSWSDRAFSRPVTADEVEACVEKGADPNAVFNCGVWTRPLATAARLGSAAAVRALIAAGATVDTQDEEGNTALHDAARYADSEGTIQALLDGGADATLRNVGGKLAWDYLQEYAQENDALKDSAVVRDLLRPE